MLFRSGWSPSTTYAQGDIVIYNDRLWQANKASVTSFPDAQTNDWTLLGGDRITQGLLNSIYPMAQHPGYLAGKNYTMLASGSLTQVAPAAIDIIYFYPFFVYAPIVFTGASIRVSVAGTASAVKSGIWANSQISNRPVRAPIYADNTGPATTGTGQIALAMTGFLPPGWYWFGAKHTGTLPQVQATNFPLGTFFPNANVISTIGLSLPDAYANDISQFAIAEGSGSFSITGTAIAALQLNT